MALENEMKICPLCGKSTLEYVNSRHWVCSECGLDLFNNVAAAVGLILYSEDNQILLEKRAKEPRKGFLALPGGFIDPDESAETACVREVKEEIGLNINESDIKFVGSSPNTYIFKNMTYKTCDIFFSCKVPADFDIKQLQIQESEVQELDFYKITSEMDIENLHLAFGSANLMLKKWLNSKKQKGQDF